MKTEHIKTIYDALGREAVHPFPARMAPSIALQIVAESKTPLRVLDPMMGSGTVLALARANGHRAVGVDIDPLAVLISKVWTTAVEKKSVENAAEIVLNSAQKKFNSLPARDAYPDYADKETRQFISYWFDPYARRQLASLSAAIAHVKDDTVRNVLWCALSRLIIAKKSGVSLAMDLSHSRPHKVFQYAPIKPFNKFLASVGRVAENCVDQKQGERGPAPLIREGDARKLPFPNETIDLVLTSPPYLNAIDYMRCSKFSLIWMGYSISDLRQLRTDSIGSEKGIVDRPRRLRSIMNGLNLRPRLVARDESILARYMGDMDLSIKEVARVLTRDGKAVYVVGENMMHGTYIRNSFLITAIAGEAGLKLTDRQTRILPANRRYLPPPSRMNQATEAMAGRMRREVVLTFQKA